VNRDRLSCSCEIMEPSFNRDVTSEYKDQCSAGGGFSQWFEYKCKSCGREWKEVLN
jgi:hypothetical protein